MSHRFQDRIVIISGAGSVGPGWGNGRAAAVAFAREGANPDYSPSLADMAQRLDRQ